MTPRKTARNKATDIVRSVDPYRSRNWEIQSSVDGGKSWQTQGNVVIAW